VSDRTISADEIGRTLLNIARSTLEEELGGSASSWQEASWLRQPGACFVTLRRGRELRGCIGSIQADRPLVEDLQANARGAAFRDPRFPPVESAELLDLTIEVSLLSPLERLEFDSEADLLKQLRPGHDGVLLEHGYHRGTFLPAVWRELREPQVFLRRLKIKAGLAEDFWSPEIAVRRYTTQSWSEADLER